jgi:hypothetical protein
VAAERDHVIEHGIRALRLESCRGDLDRVLEGVVDRTRVDRVDADAARGDPS